MDRIWYALVGYKLGEPQPYPPLTQLERDVALFIKVNLTVRGRSGLKKALERLLKKIDSWKNDDDAPPIMKEANWPAIQDYLEQCIAEARQIDET
jgi:hypothetical protein